jgi:type II secretory pathway pseudopilin PulG
MPPAHYRQRGVAAVILLALLGIVLAGSILVAISGSRAATAVDEQTSRALSQAREALIARAAADNNRPGSLPCPDVNDDGMSTIAPDWTGSVCTSYVGRLPFKTLDLPDLRDANGERLWYALSPAFRDNVNGGTLNSDTSGALAIAGSINLNGVVAIVFAVGPPLTGQDRSGAGALQASNYLDGENGDGDTDYEQQPVSEAFNDRLLPITGDLLFQAVERRVAHEAKLCLEAIAVSNRYPWAAPMANPAAYDDALNTYVGRVPRVLNDTDTSLTTATPTPLPATAGWPAMAYGVQCFGTSTWWDDWMELIVYHVSPAFAPNSSGGPCGTCLQVNGNIQVPVLIIVAGRALSDPDQSSRSVNQDQLTEYLESKGGVDNFAGSGVYVRALAEIPVSGAQFNDRVECVGISTC